MGRTWPTIERAEEHFGIQIPDESTLQRLEQTERTYGRETHDWIAEGMPAEIMGKTRDMEAFRQRQADRPPEVSTNIERQNKRSVLRSEKAATETEPAGETGVPEPVRAVISSRGRSLDGSIQRAMEDRMGDSFGDVRIHTGSTAAAACESINARAFTVGNHIAFNSGEYDPSSPEGQHVLAHELAHVRQQIQGAVSMLPQDDVELEVDADPALEREAEETAQRVVEGSELGIQGLGGTKVHVQRLKSSERLLDELDSEQKQKINPIIKNTEDFDSIEAYISQLTGQIKGLNHKLHKKGKIRKTTDISMEDIEIIEHREGERPHYLLNTNKWSAEMELTGTGMHDFKHITARHGHPDSTDKWPVSPGNEQRSTKEAFPVEWGPQKIKQIIQLTIKQGQKGDDSGELVYQGPKIAQYDFDEVVVRRNSSTGVIQTVFPRRS